MTARRALLLLMVRGKEALSAEDLLGCFVWPAAGHDAAEAAALLRELIRGDELDETERCALLRWCTSRSTLPIDGLKDKVEIQLLRPPVLGGGAAGDQWHPLAHTCYPSIELPAYSCKARLHEQLRRAITNMTQGGFDLQ